MLVREGGHADAEVTGVPYQPHQVLGVAHALGMGDPLPGRVAGRVTPMGEAEVRVISGEPGRERAYRVVELLAATSVERRKPSAARWSRPRATLPARDNEGEGEDAYWAPNKPSALGDVMKKVIDDGK